MHSRLAYIVALFGAASLQCQAALRISEFMAVNQSGLEDEDGNTPDWIEILNDSAAPADLTGYALTDDPASPTKWQLPAGLTISPGATLVVFASDKNRTPVGGELHTNFKLSSAGEYLALVAPDGITHAYQPTFPPQVPDISFGLDPSTPATGYFTTPTPGAPNGQPGPTPVGGVDFSADSQTFTSSLSVTLTNHLPGTTILYTTDGSDPATAGTVYTTPVSITTSTELRALAKLTGQNTGPATTRHYLKLAADTQSFSSPLPVVVLDNFAAGRVPQRNSSTGPNGNDGSGVIQVERQPVLMAIFDRDTQTGQATPAAPPAITSHAGIRVRGSSSSGLRKKSFSMETWQDGAREEPDNIAPFAMPSESDWILYAPTETFSGNRYDRSLLHNSFIYQLSNEIGRYAVRTQFVELFLNTGGGDLTMADYAGLYIFMEKRKRDNGRIGFDQLSQDASTGGWMISVDRMDPKPVGGTGTPRHFHTPGPDQVLQTTNDSPFGVRNRDDRPEFYHSFFNFKSPDGYAVNTAQRTAIETAMNDFEDALYAPDWTDPTTGYAAHIDVDNFIDHYILNNLTKNQDAYVLSTLIYRSTPDDPIRFGPIWDFDRGYNTSPTSTNPRANLRFADNRMWYPRLFGHTDFEQKYIDRWQQLREGLFATSHMDAIIDTQKNEITEPVALRNRTSNWPSKVATMKSWLATRTAAIDARFTPKPTFTFEGSSATISHPAYYTTDGTDPRQPGGNISPTARSTAGGQFDTTFISTGQPCRYHIPSDETLGLSWTATFDDSTWTQATPGLGWESPIVPTLTPAITTDIEDQMRRENASGYFRWQFDLDDPSTINTLTLNVTIDDGFVAYLNGIRIGDFNAPDPIAWNSEATGSRSDSAVIDTPVQIDATPFKSSLRPGTNILAIH
ncbi:MAG: CotH kinase family protein, partial [Verrucomicrobiales bacterium]|nr:CotH kinase family protein [Verrucomicrobiales bacterium]